MKFTTPHHKHLTQTRTSFDARRKLIALAAAGMFALPMPPAWVATITVGVGGCTLVDAITAANTDKAKGHCRAGKGADTVVLPRNSVHTLTAVHHRSFYGAGNGLPEITSPITIQGNGSTIRRRPDAESFRIFEVRHESLTLLNTTISGGRVEGDGGAISSYDGVVTLRGCTVIGNSAIRVPRMGTPNSEYGGFGGGINSENYYGTSRLNLTDSTVSGNRSTLDGGGVFSYGTLSMVNSTVFANSSGGKGGGVWEGGFQNYASSTIRNSTISGNIARRGGGLHHARKNLIISHSTITENSAIGRGSGLSSDGYSSHGIALSATIVAGNRATDLDSLEPGSGFESRGDNLIGTGNAGRAFKARGDRTGVADPRLSALADNGGPTLTHALRSDSPAVDAVTGTCRRSETDQRGYSRPADGDRNGKARCDIGAFELDGNPSD